jgi:hypothetical protein
MAYYDIDTENLVRDNTPQFKREQFPVVLRLIVGLLKPFTRLVNILKVYKEGTTDIWTAGNYNKGDLVAYNGQVFEAKVDTIGTTPDITADWRLITTMWRGAYEAQTYATSTMMLEYALNRYWGLTYSTTPLASDIYVTTNTLADSVFAVATDSTFSNVVGVQSSEGVVPVNFSVSTITTNLTIHVPIAWYTSLGLNANEKIQAFADNYVAFGLTYNITTY